MSAAVLGLVLVALPAAAYLAWHVEPAWTLTAALVLSCFNSNWEAFGLPRFVAPDRLLLLAGLAALLLRAPPGRPPLRLGAVHVVLAATLAWAVGSALAAGTVGRGETVFELLDRFAVPFAVFAAAPLAFRTRRHRQGFLAVIVAFGAYLGLTAVFETVGPQALVFPRFIVSDSLGYHADRARGPFLEADVNGTGLFVCGTLALVAAATWRGAGRVAAYAVAVLCAVGVLFTLTRSVWAGAVVAAAVTLVSAPELRRFALPAGAAAALAVAGLLVALPAFGQKAAERRAAQFSVWERANVNAAALAMVEARPMLGFGLGTFAERNGDYFPMLDDLPQLGQRRLGIHNVFLALATELGLVGASLFAIGLLMAVAGALRRRGPPELRPWRRALLAIALFWAVVASFAPFGQVFPSMIVWLVAGIVLGAATAPGAEAART